MLFRSTISQSQVDGINTILDAGESVDRRHLAYMLATAHHETARSMQPIEEYGKGAHMPYGGRWRMDRKPYTDTQNIFYGRGFVQLTWYENYERAGKKIGVDLIAHPELALEIGNATRIMFYGMADGWFTGRKLSDYINETRTDYVNARRIINGVDRAELVAGYAKLYDAALA